MVGKVGGRGLPLVAADLLKFNLGARRYAGSPAQLAISEPPPAPEAKPDPLRLLAKKAAGGNGQGGEGGAAQGASPLPAPRLVRQATPDRTGRPTVPRPRARAANTRKPWGRFLAVAAAGVLAVVVLLPTTALADDPDDEDPGWRLDEIYFVPPEPVPGRRIFIEGISVTPATPPTSPCGPPTTWT